MRSIVLRSRNIPAHAGKLEVVKLPLANRRNIPAHAGKTLLGGGTQPPKSEHPRARGENEFIVRHYHDGEGTSPRTRGKPGVVDGAVQNQRNIPAHAGKTRKGGVRVAATKEHPRARGENAVRKAFLELHLGTSPRTRGKPPICSRVNGLVRNIPAHAGKTAGLSFFSSSSAEHPRARGENIEHARLGDIG